jgi:Homeodomain-like domain-containing protein
MKPLTARWPMSAPDGPNVIGLGAAERAAYELLVDQPAATLDDLAAAWTRPEPLPAVLAALEERTLISSSPGPPVHFTPVAPDVAFGAQLSDYEEQLDRARRHLGILDAAFQARPAEHSASTVIEVVTGQRAIRQRLRQLQRSARTHIGCLAKPPYFDNDGTTDAALEMLGRGLVCRTVYARAAIEHPGALATVERLTRAGQESRVLPDVPLSLYLSDDKLAVLPLRRHLPTAEAAVIVHPSALLDALVKLFEGMWQRALPLHPPGEEQRTGVDQQRLITLLLSGLTDEAIARQLGLSHRTVQRRVATFMADLGAHTRFQAGVKAALQQRRCATLKRP